MVHGSTVATNALLERKGARTAFVTTSGFEDLIAIGRQNRPELYNLTPALPVPLVPPDLCFGATERILFDGSVELPLKTGTLPRRVAASGAESVAICLLHSCQNDAHETALLAVLRKAMPEAYICASCDISPEFREFERASTTVINAYVGPLMDRYLGELEEASPFRRRHAVERGSSTTIQPEAAKPAVAASRWSRGRTRSPLPPSNAAARPAPVETEEGEQRADEARGQVGGDRSGSRWRYYLVSDGAAQTPDAIGWHAVTTRSGGSACTGSG